MDSSVTELKFYEIEITTWLDFNGLSDLYNIMFIFFSLRESYFMELSLHSRRREKWVGISITYTRLNLENTAFVCNTQLHFIIIINI